MRYLRSFVLFESESDPDLDNFMWVTLKGMASFPQLLELHEEAWAAVVGLWDWEEYLEHFSNRDNRPPLSEEEYSRYQKAYEGTPSAQITFDDFIASVLGHTEFPAEIQEDEDSLEWYMEHYEQPRTIASMMKAMVHRNQQHLDLDPAWQ